MRNKLNVHENKTKTTKLNCFKEQKCFLMVLVPHSFRYIYSRLSSLYSQRGARETAGEEDRTRASGFCRGQFPRFIHQRPHQLPQEELRLNEP